MKKIIVLLVFVLFSSCSKEDNNSIDPNSLIGTWRLAQVTFNQIDGAELNDWISNSTTMKLVADRSYYRNYLIGKWDLKGNILAFVESQSVSESTRKYEILKLTDEVLSVQISLTDMEYCCDLDQFEENEVITITENYIKLE